MWAKYMFAGRNMNNTLFKWRAAKRSLQTELINEECDNYLIEHEDISLNNDHEINFENFSADEAEENEENNLADELTEKQNIWNFENNSVLTFNYLDGATLFVLRHKKNDAHDSIFRNSKLFPGSNHSVEDLSLSIQLLRTTCRFGDTEQGLILGLIAAFLPENNPIVQELGRTVSRTQYRFNELIYKGSSAMLPMPTYKILICQAGCIAFCGLNKDLTACSVCALPRFFIIIF